MESIYYVNSQNGEFEGIMQREYQDKEETDFRGRRQRFYRIGKTLVTITSWNSPKARGIPKGKVCIDIDDNKQDISQEIEKKTGYKLRRQRE